VRAALAQFAEGNFGKLQGWLDRVAARDPAKAADLFLRMLEYYIPKLARTELASDPEAKSARVIRVEFVNATDDKPRSGSTSCPILCRNRLKSFWSRTDLGCVFMMCGYPIAMRIAHRWHR
jgi:hypothetical protein